MGELYIGLISGTSMDGVDATLVKFGDTSLQVIQTREHPYPTALRRTLIAVVNEPADTTVDIIGQLDRRVGECFRDAARALLDDAGIDASAVVAVGSHGQTVRHQPNLGNPFTLQIGEPSVIAKGTGITTVADFRRSDLACGGQGAPLTPLFHDWLFRQPGTHRVVLNIGGIANVTVLPAGKHVTTGFDTGPGNTLLDAWVRKHRDTPYDANGSWAAGGSVNEALLSRLRADPYFSAAPPKSTGFEHFNLHWLESATTEALDPVDVQATLCALTADSIATAVESVAAKTSEVLVCGGGVHNAELLRRLGARLPTSRIGTTAEAGLDPDWVEACAFAWLAMRRIQGQPGNLPSATGATRSAVLGSIHSAD